MSEKIVCPKGFDCSLLNSCPAFKQDCPAGFFCDTYEGNKFQSDLDLNYAKLVTRFQDVVVTNQNKEKYVDVNRTIQAPCFQGFFCPTDNSIEVCMLKLIYCCFLY
ncbi:hypothetical protein EON65_14005 [archaeon]|nr:MAG: hypothetical protein EON65_14005 [archaeon]